MWLRRSFFTCSIPALVISLSGCLVSPESLTTPVPEYTRSGDWSEWRARVATLNIWGLPGVAKYLDERMMRVGPELKRRELDFAFLQETWQKGDRKRIVKDSGLAYGHSFGVPRTIGSGLFNLSAFALTRASFREFSLNGNLAEIWEGDALAGKGVGMTTLELRGLPISMFNTHAIARYNGNGNEVSDPHTLDRMLQMFEIFRHIVEQTDSDAFVVAGDFNMRHFQTEYQFWRDLTSLDGIRAEETDGKTCTLCEDNPLTSYGEGQIDYIFVSPRLRIASYQREFDQTFPAGDGARIPLSDHYGWLSQIRVAQPSEIQIEQDRAIAKTAWTISTLRHQLETYLETDPSIDRESPSGIEDRLCRICHVRSAIEVLRNYEVAMAPETRSAGSKEVTVLRTRLKSYFGLFRR